MPETPSQQRDDLRIGGGALLVLAGAALIAWSTLRSQPGEFGLVAVARWSPFEALLNVVLFLPFGAGLSLLGVRVRRVLAYGLALSVLVEVAQLLVVQGRYASLADVTANGLGALLGAWIVLHWDRRARWWRWASPVVVVGIVFTWVIGGYLAQPAIPRIAEWRVEQGPFPVLEAQLQGVPLREGQPIDVPELRSLLLASRKTRLTLDVVTGEGAEGRTRIFALVSGANGSSFLTLEQEGTTLLGYQRSGLRWVGLRTPWIELRDALPPGAGDTIHIELVGTRRHILLTTSTGGVSRQAALRLSPDLYVTALFARATDWLLWWWIVPETLCFVALGLALATRPRLTAVLLLLLLVIIPNRADCAYPGIVGAAFSILGTVVGMRLGKRIGLFAGPEGAGEGSAQPAREGEYPCKP